MKRKKALRMQSSTNRMLLNFWMKGSSKIECCCATAVGGDVLAKKVKA